MKTFSWLTFAALALFLSFPSCGGSGYSGGGGGGGSAPSAPTGLTTTAGDKQVALTWLASSTATGYHVKRSTTTGGPYTQVAIVTVTNDTDVSLTNGAKYFYVVSAVNSYGESANSSEASATPAVSAPAPPTGLVATAGNQQVGLTWSASAGATGYHVKRSTTTGGPYAQVAAPATTSDTDNALTNGTKYFYVVTAFNITGESPDSSEVFATPAAATASVHVTVNVLSSRHPISQYVYGGSYPKDAATVTDSGLSVVRWGGNSTSRYNWKTFTYNAANDYYYSDYMGGEIGDADSATFVTHTIAAGSNPLMSMVMLDWVSKGDPANGTGNGQLYSFSVAKYGAQCAVNPSTGGGDAGDGLKANPTCNTPANVAGNDPNDANVPMRDSPQPGDPAGTIYRNQWAAALATAFGSTPHFYDMDNEIDIWGGTHRDVHPNPSGYNELRDTYLRVARNLKTWDPKAIRLGPVSCCWWFYFNGANGSDKAAHAGDDFLPWWLNEVALSDKVAGSRSLDYFDIHSYPDAPDTSGLTLAQEQALAVRIYRDYWDPTYVSESKTINQTSVTQIQPNRTIPFRIPRMRAIANATYPGTPLAITEWSAEFAGTTPAQRAADFSTALGDADAYGILGRERVDLASRWVAPDPANPNYQALKLFRNYDGAHHGFQTISVDAAHDADANLFSSYAAVNASGTSMTLLAINKDPTNAVATAFALNGFTPSQVTTYTLSSTSPNSIVASASGAWTSTVTLPKYSAMLFVITGTTANNPATEWDPNPDTTMVPAGGTALLLPRIVSGTGTVTLGIPASDNGITLAITQGIVTPSQGGAVSVSAGNTPGFYHYTLPGMDNSGVAQNQSGWIVVGKPAATFTKTGDNQTGTHGATLNVSVTLVPGASGGTATGASVLFTTDAGSLSSRIVPTNGSGVAAVVLTLPATAGTIHITADGPVGLGHPAVTFTETSQ